MSSGDAPTIVGESLADRLVRNGVLGDADAVRIVARVAEQIQGLHAAGLFHGTISPEMVLFDESDSARLASRAAGPLVVDPSANEELFPPALLRNREGRPAAVIELPESIVAARDILEAAGAEIDPAGLDLYQLGGLMCRLLTGEPVGAYLRSPRVKGQVPADCQAVIDRALGLDASERFVSVAELSARLAPLRFEGEASSSDAEEGTGAEEGEAGAAADTSPSVVSLAPEPDTSIDSQPVPVPPAEGERLPFNALGHYEIIRRIGRGGMGDVYLGYEKALDRKVAIKVLPADFGRHDDFVRRFYAEATAAARLSHPNIIDIYYIGEDQGHHFFAMQYVDGETLATMLARHRRLSVDQTMSIATGALQGLAAAHQRGMVHRDIKPGNILLDRENRRVLVADFGLVKSLQGGDGLTATGTVMGTVDYISPEQGKGKPVDARSDLYSFGVLLYRMLSGELPFHADSPTAMIFQHVYETPQPLTSQVPGLPAVLSAVVDKLLAKSPDDRYGGAADVLADLRAFRESRPLPSGADVIVPGDDDAGIVLLEEASPSIIIEAPSFEDEPQIPENLDDAAPTGIWGRLRNRVIDAVEERAPEFVDYLQNTQQQVGHAVAEYERRQRNLAQLVAEAESVLKELQEQAEEWRAAAPGSREAPQQLKEIENQIAAQREQLEAIQLRLSKANAKLQQLCSQRDLLNARLKAAQARMRIAGGRVVKRRRRIGILALAIGVVAVLMLAMILTFGWWISGSVAPPVVVENDPAATPIPAEPDNAVVDVTVVAESGFNDKEGIHSSSDLHEPFRVDGNLEGAGGGEKGWSGNWRGSPTLVTVQSAVTQEGDGAAFIRTDQANASRIFPRQSGTLSVEQYVRLPAGGRIVARVRNSSYGPFNKDGIACQWSATAGGEFDVLDGEGNGCPTGSCSVVNTGIRCEPDRWYKVNVIVDVSRQTYEFEVDGTRYKDPLGFRGRPASLDELHYATPTPEGAYLDAVKVVAARETAAASPAQTTRRTVDVADGAVELYVATPASEIGSAAFQPIIQGDPPVYRLVTGSLDGRLTVHSMSFNKPLRSSRLTVSIKNPAAFPAHLSPIRAIAYSPDGELLASAADDGSVRIWHGRAALLSELRSLEGHEEAVHRLHFSADGSQLLSGSADGTVRLWDVRSGAELGRVEVGNQAKTLVGSPAGPDFFVAGDYAGDRASVIEGWSFQQNRPVRLIEIEQWKPRKDIIPEILIPKVSDIGFAETSSSGPLVLWDRSSGKTLHTLGDNVSKTAVSANGLQILTSDRRGELSLWDPQTGSLRLNFQVAHPPAHVISLSADGRIAAAVDRSSLQIWLLPLAEQGGEFLQVNSPVEALAISGNGLHFAAGQTSGLSMWDLDQDWPSSLIPSPQAHVSSVTYLPDSTGLIYAVGTSASNTVGIGTIEKFGVSRYLIREAARLEAHAERITSVSCSPNGRQIVSSSLDGTLRVWDVKTRSELAQIEIGSPVYSAQFSPTANEQVVVGSNKKNVELWDVLKTEKVREYAGLIDRPRAVAFSDDGSRIAGGGGAGVICVWEADSGNLLATLEGHRGSVNSVAFLSDSRFIVSGGGDATVRFWSVEGENEVAVFRGHTAAVSSVVVTPRDNHVIAGGADGSIRRWKLPGSG